MSATTGGRPDDQGTSGRPPSIHTGGKMQTEMLHGDVIARMLTSDELDQEFGQAGDVVLSGYRTARGRMADEDVRAWSRELQRLRKITDRADADVRRDVLRALLLDRLVPMTVDAQVRDGVVTLTGTVGSQRQRQDATYLAG